MFLVINGIVVVFPILVYTFFIVYEENMKLEELENYLEKKKKFD